jgi:hypothetical protein
MTDVAAALVSKHLLTDDRPNPKRYYVLLQQQGIENSVVLSPNPPTLRRGKARSRLLRIRLSVLVIDLRQDAGQIEDESSDTTKRTSSDELPPYQVVHCSRAREGSI